MVETFDREILVLLDVCRGPLFKAVMSVPRLADAVRHFSFRMWNIPPVELANGTQIQSDEGAIETDGTSIETDGASIQSDGAAIQSDGSSIEIDGAQIQSDGASIESN